MIYASYTPEFRISRLWLVKGTFRAKSVSVSKFISNSLKTVSKKIMGKRRKAMIFRLFEQNIRNIVPIDIVGIRRFYYTGSIKKVKTFR